MNSRDYDDQYLADRLKRLEGVTDNQQQSENERLRRENEMLKQRLQMAADPVRVEFEQSEEFRNAWMTNVVSYLYEANMSQWAQSPYAKRLDEWTQSRVDEIRAMKQPAPQRGKHPKSTDNGGQKDET